MCKAWRWICRHPLMVSVLLVAIVSAAGILAHERNKTNQLLREGEDALRVHEYLKARDYFTRYLEERPDDARAHLLAARSSRRLREYYDAAEHLKNCRANGGDAEAIDAEYTLIDVQRGKEEPSSALRERSRIADELGLAILEVLIQFDLDTYRLHGALDELTQYLSHRPDDLQALLARGYVWERFLYFSDALEDYKKAVALHPNSETARLKLADCLLIAGTPGESLEQYEWLSTRQPERIDVRLGLAKCKRRLGLVDEARRLLSSLVTDASTNGEVLWERGLLDMDSNNLPEAEKWLRKAIQVLPHDRRINYSLYCCLLAQNRKEEAERINARVAEIESDLRQLDLVCKKVMNRPDDPGLRCKGGMLFLRNGERREGIRWLQMALNLDPTCETARAELAKIQRSAQP